MKNIKPRTQVLHFLPEQLKSLSLTAKTPYHSGYLKNAYLIDITHGLILKYYYKKVNSFNLSSVILREKYGTNYNHYMRHLVEKKVIHVIKKARVNVNATVYALDRSILTEHIGRFKSTDTVLLKKYNKKMAGIEVANEYIDKDIREKLINDSFDVRIDYDAAMHLINYTIQIRDVYNKNKYSIETINDNDIYHHFDQYGRMHTNFTILKTTIRKNNLTIDGEELMELDIKNSQPSFLAKMINESTQEDIDEEELRLFNALTNEGTLYEYFLLNSQYTEREDVKEMVYTVLFGKNIYLKSRSRYTNIADDVFRSLFPTIHQYVIDIKANHKDYKVLSHMLQRSESNLIYNKIIREIMSTDPSIKMITVHDSIMFPRRYSEVVTEIFKRHERNEFSLWRNLD